MANIQAIDSFLASHQKELPPEKLQYLHDKLFAADDAALSRVSAVKLHNPAGLVLVSVFLGFLGVDRFLLGDPILGLLKLLTLGGFGVLTVMDWFLIARKARQVNFERLMARL